MQTIDNRLPLRQFCVIFENATLKASRRQGVKASSRRRPNKARGASATLREEMSYR
jgi:hypothetical protein